MSDRWEVRHQSQHRLQLTRSTRGVAVRAAAACNTDSSSCLCRPPLLCTKGAPEAPTPASALPGLPSPMGVAPSSSALAGDTVTGAMMVGVSPENAPCSFNCCACARACTLHYTYQHGSIEVTVSFLGG